MEKGRLKRKVVAFLLAAVMGATMVVPQGAKAKQKDSLIITNLPEGNQMVIGVVHDFNKSLVTTGKTKGNYVTKWILTENQAEASISNKGEVVAKKAGTFVLTVKNIPTKDIKEKYGSNNTTLKSKSIKIRVLKDRIITKSDIKNGTLSLSSQTYGNLLIENDVGDAQIKLNSVKVVGKLILQKGASYSVVTQNSIIESVCTSESGKITLASVDEKTEEIPRLIIKSGSEVSKIIVDSHMSITQEGSGQIVSVQVKSAENGKLDISLNGFKGLLVVEAEEGANVTIHTTNCEIKSATVEGKSTENKIEIKDSATTTENASIIGEVKVKGKSQLSLDVKSEKVTVSGDDVALKLQNQIKELVTEGKNAKIEVSKEASVTTVSAKGENTLINGEGKVENVKVEGNNASINTSGTKIEVKEKVEGVTAGGNKVKAGTQTTTDSLGGNNTTGGVYTDPEATQKEWFNEVKPKLDEALKVYVYYLFGEGRNTAALDQKYTDDFYQKVLAIYNSSSLSLSETYKPSNKKSIEGMEIFSTYVYDVVVEYMCAVDPVYKENYKLSLNNDLTVEQKEALNKKLSVFQPNSTYSYEAAKKIKPACERLIFFYNRFMNVGSDANTTAVSKLNELVKIVNGRDWSQLSAAEQKNAKAKVIEILGLVDTNNYNVLKDTSRTNAQLLEILNKEEIDYIAMRDICWNTAKEGSIKYFSENYDNGKNKDRFGKRAYIYESLTEIIRDVYYAEEKKSNYESMKASLINAVKDLSKNVTMKENGSDKWIEIASTDSSSLTKSFQTLFETYAINLSDEYKMENKEMYLGSLEANNLSKLLINLGYGLLINEGSGIYQLDEQKINAMKSYEVEEAANQLLSGMEWVGKYAIIYRNTLKDKTDQAVLAISKIVPGNSEDILSGREEALTAITNLVNAADAFGATYNDEFSWYITEKEGSLDGFVRRAKNNLETEDESIKTATLRALYFSLQTEGTPLSTYSFGDKASLKQLMEVTESMIQEVDRQKIEADSYQQALQIPLNLTIEKVMAASGESVSLETRKEAYDSIESLLTDTVNFASSPNSPFGYYIKNGDSDGFAKMALSDWQSANEEKRLLIIANLNNEFTVTDNNLSIYYQSKDSFNCYHLKRALESLVGEIK